MIYFWLLIVLVLIPAIVFAVKPEAPLWRHVLRWVGVIGLTYVCLNLALHWSHLQRWERHAECRQQSTHRIDSIEMFEECRHHAPHSGADTVFYLFFGWIPAFGYLGALEILWRRKYRDALKSAEISSKGNTISQYLVIVSVPIVGLFAFGLLSILIVKMVQRMGG